MSSSTRSEESPSGIGRANVSLSRSVVLRGYKGTPASKALNGRTVTRGTGGVRDLGNVLPSGRRAAPSVCVNRELKRARSRRPMRPRCGGRSRRFLRFVAKAEGFSEVERPDVTLLTVDHDNTKNQRIRRKPPQKSCGISVVAQGPSMAQRRICNHSIPLQIGGRPKTVKSAIPQAIGSQKQRRGP